jgi:hypothetical protein
MRFCNCAESVSRGPKAMITQTMLRVDGHLPRNWRWVVTTCAHCHQVLHRFEAEASPERGLTSSEPSICRDCGYATTSADDLFAHCCQ